MNTDTATATAAVTILGFVLGLIKWVIGAFSKRDREITNLKIDLAVQQGKVEVLSATVASSEQRMAEAVEGVRKDISEMTKRLDSLIQTMADRAAFGR